MRPGAVSITFAVATASAPSPAAVPASLLAPAAVSPSRSLPPEPVWWRAVPDTVAAALAALGEQGIPLGSDVPMHLAVREYTDAAARLFLARADGSARLRPSASLDLEPARILLVHGLDTGWSGRAYLYASDDDVTAALRGAVADSAPGPAVALTITFDGPELPGSALTPSALTVSALAVSALAVTANGTPPSIPVADLLRDGFAVGVAR